ncbi:hypothetical protein G6F59_014120 [Rhizopus arrhizus]|nr:hypothetical protein G6F59_014120 [Rhizopus arrhizus]
MPAVPFDLQGRAVGGQYEYFLFKDATNGGWYLRSELATVPDPCVVDPTLPECGPIVDPVDPVEPTPVLRPETGAYLANQFAVDQLLRHGWRDRQGGSTTAEEGVRGWARVDANQSKLGAVNDQLDLRVDRSRVQLGADMGVFDNGRGRLGVMGTLAQSSATSRSELTGYSAKARWKAARWACTAAGTTMPCTWMPACSAASSATACRAKAWPRSATIRISGRARWKPVTASASARSAAPP